MATTDKPLIIGDILRGIVDHVDSELDAAFVDCGPHGTVFCSLGALKSTAVARLVPNHRVCVQIVSPRRGRKLPKARLSIEMAGRTSVIILDGTSIVGKKLRPKISVHVSKEISGTRRGELVSKMEEILSSESESYDEMVASLGGDVEVLLRTAADASDWDFVVMGVKKRLYEAGAFISIARMGSTPALLITQKEDSDGGSLIAGATSADPSDELNGRTIKLSGGGDVVFERTEAMWTVDVNSAHAHARSKYELLVGVNREAASIIQEAIREYNATGLIAIDFISGMTNADFYGLIDILNPPLGRCSYITGDTKLSVVLISRNAKKVEIFRDIDEEDEAEREDKHNYANGFYQK